VKRLALAVCLLASLTARAATSDCSKVSDGTPCIGPCIAVGQCMGGTCQASMLSPDGTPCSSGNACSTGDSCVGGVCMQGSGMVTCPDKGPCMKGMCDPMKGCVVVNKCKPDMSTPPPMDLSPPDDLMSTDLAGMDLSGQPTDDLAGTGDDQSMPPDDSGTSNDAGLGDGGPGIVHVRGSALGGGCDCQLGGHGTPTGTVLSALFLLALALRRRPRSMDANPGVGGADTVLTSRKH
jgi:MYXO-CTERM domain-containing protein